MEDCKETGILSNFKNEDVMCENVKLEAIEDTYGFIKTEIDTEETSEFWGRSEKINEEGTVAYKDTLTYLNITDNEPQSENIKLEETEVLSGRIKTENISEDLSISLKQNSHEVINNLLCKDDSGIKGDLSISGNEFKLPNLMAHHLTTCSTENNFKCGVCDKSFVTLKKLKYHSKYHRNAGRYSCEVCNKKFSRNINLTEHLARHTKERNYKCHVCEKSFFNKANLNVHIRRHLATKDFKCNECDRGFTTLRELKIHTTKRKSINGQYECDVCKKSFSRLLCLRVHLMTHSKSLLMCRFCQQLFKTNHSLMKHIGTHTDEGHKCKHCGKVFTTKHKALQHTKQQNDGNLSYKCGVCKDMFPCPQLLKNHKLIHLKANQIFPCEFCEKQFRTKPKLYLHTQKHIGKSNVCQVCSYECTSQNHMLEHFRSHTKENPFQCQYCERCFVSIDTRKKHEQIHTGTKKTHKCSYCGKVFPQRTNLVIHERQHTGECPFRCDICSVSFSQNSLLTKHMKRHHNV